MRYVTLATDYDGTIAADGVVDEPTLDALRRLKASGRRLVAVSGRLLPDLQAACPEADELFDRIVAENGALLYDPGTREERLLCAPADERFVAALRDRHVEPLSVGRAIVATWHPQETVALEAIRDLGLELELIFNKGAVMALPAGVSKAGGLAAALADLGVSRHNVAGVGDAENDHAFLQTCECSAAVANALPSLKERVDVVLEGDHGAGVRELVERLLKDDLKDAEPRLGRHHIPVGVGPGDEPVAIAPYGGNLLVAGRSGGGKSTLALALLEGLGDHGYQFVVVDPEGDFETVGGAIVLGSADQPPVIDEVLAVLADPARSVIVSLLALPLAERPPFFQGLFPLLERLRAESGRPHWLLLDEAHHLLPSSWEPADEVLAEDLSGMILVTVHPGAVAPPVLKQITTCVAVGAEPLETLAEFAQGTGASAPGVPDGPQGFDDVLWRRGEAARRFRAAEPRAETSRHRRKYAEGELGEDKSFYFRGPEGRLNLRAQNLQLFQQLADGVDDDTWEHHLRRHDYSAWMRDAIKDEELAADVEAIENDEGLEPRDSRERVGAAIDKRYTAAA